MVCPSCSAANPDNIRFCGQCGRGLLASSDDRETIVLDGPQAPPPGPPALPFNLQPGSPFASRYRIESLLGEGGMGAVYKAHDSELGRTVALKLVRPELATSPQTMQRFKQELLLASKISHKNILRIHDLGDWNGVKFITMAFVEGSDLAGFMEKQGRLPFERAVKFTRQLCAALEAAHSEGVVHRDLKPQNILIDQADHVYVSDFGLAKSLEPEATMMTRTGQILGTPRYMSPEQVEAKEVDHRSDLYSLGLIVYEMFTGEIPFRGDSAMQLMYQRVTEPPRDPRIPCPELPDYLANIILKCLEKDPARRYRSAREILDDLEAEHAPAVSAPAGTATISIQLPRPSRRLGLLLAALAVVVGLAFSIPFTRHWILRSPSSSATTGRPLHYMAVLPLNVAGDAALQYVADGVVDALSAKLSGLREVYVAPGNAVNDAMSQKDPRKVAHTLGVTVLVSGTLQSSGDRISITLAMDDVGGNGRNLLHREFSGVRQDLLTLEDNIFTGVAGALAIRQSSEERARTTMRPTQDFGAYDLYLQGRNVLRGKREAKNLAKALDLFEQARTRDPGFALAFAGSADASLMMYNLTKESSWSQRALGAAQQAQRLNDSLPEAHFSLGSIYAATGKSSEAVVELQHALRLAPNSDQGLMRLGRAYELAGRKPEAIAAYTEATRVNPYSWANYNLLGAAYFRQGENGSAMTAFRHITELEPDMPTGWANMGAVYYRQGKWNECIAAFQKAIDLDPRPFYYSQLGVANFFLGRFSDSVKMFETAVDKSPNDAGFRVNLADAYRWSNQRDKAAATYDKAIELAYKNLEVNPRDTEALGVMAISYAKKGDANNALRFIRQARQIDQGDNDLMYHEATIHALAGRTGEALTALGEAIRHGSPVEQVRSDPEFADLRKKPEYDKLMKEVPPAEASK